MRREAAVVLNAAYSSRAMSNLTVSGLDYSNGRPNFAQLHQAGYRYVMRYLPVPGTRRQDIDRKELLAAWNAGIEVGLIWESAANRALGGHDAGWADAQSAHKQCLELAVPDAPVFFAVDFDASDKQKPTIAEYFRAVEQVLGKDRTGVYGSFYVIRYLVGKKLCRWYWQTYAWSGGNVHKGAHILQYHNGGTVGNLSVDFNKAVPGARGTVAKPGPHPTPHPAPHADDRKLKVWERELHGLRHEADLRREYGSKHPWTVAMRVRARKLERLIAREQRRHAKAQRKLVARDAKLLRQSSNNGGSVVPSKAQVLSVLSATVFVPASAVISGWLLKHFPGLPAYSPKQIADAQYVVASGAIGIAVHYLHGLKQWQQLETFGQEAGK